MGKTKTVLVEGIAEEQKSGKESYEERRKRKEAQKKVELEKAKIEGLGLKGGQRIKVVSGETPLIEEVQKEATEVKEKPKRIKKRGKKYLSAKVKVDKNKLYPLSEAVKLLKEISYSKFEGTIELHLVVKKSGISERVNLPYSYGKQKKVEVANEGTIEKLKKGKIDFDVLLATPDMMPKLIPFAKILGPRGLMPNPKNQTIIKSEKDAGKFLGNTIRVATEKETPIIHTIVGKLNQKDEEIIENIKAIFNAVGTKQILKAYLKSTMSPSLKLALNP